MIARSAVFSGLHLQLLKSINHHSQGFPNEAKFQKSNHFQRNLYTM